MQGRLIINYPNAPNKSSTFIPNCELNYYSYNNMLIISHNPLEGNGDKIVLQLLVLVTVINKDSISFQGFIETGEPNVYNNKYYRWHLDFFPTPESLTPKLKQGKES